MTRRTLTPPPVAEARAGDRMAPGGRLWSESPIRTFRRPVKQAGEVTTPPPPTITARGLGEMGTGGMMSWSSAIPAAGDTLVATAISPGTTLTAPTGWTVLATGTLSGQKWIVAYGTAVGGSATEGLFTGAAGAAANGRVYAGEGTPTLVGAPAVSGPGAMSVQLADVSGSGLALPVQEYVAVSDDGGGRLNPQPRPADYDTPQQVAQLFGGVSITRSTLPAGLSVAGSPGGPYPAVPQYQDFARPCAVVSMGWGFS